MLIVIVNFPTLEDIDLAVIEQVLPHVKPHIGFFSTQLAVQKQEE
ncbi:hypothetical protein QUB22_07895 [Microcoleus sp. AT9_A5]